MILYHGSDRVINNPKILQSDRFLDFGKGFYTTKNKEQAIRWAQKVRYRKKNGSQFISIYNFDYDKAMKELVIIHFTQANEQWLNFVCACRSGGSRKGYDLVIGPVADDKVYTTLVLYENGVLDKDETIKRLKVEKLYDQVLFHSEKSLLYLSFINSKEIEGSTNG